MSNYSKTVNFAVKDSLTTGDPSKLILGTELDTEFNNLATAVATKADASAVASLTLQNAILFSIASPGAGTTITNTNAGTAAYTLLGLVNDASNAVRFAISSSTYSGSYLTTGPAGQAASIYTNSTSVPLSLGTNSTERLRIDAAGASINLKATAIQGNGVDLTPEATSFVGTLTGMAAGTTGSVFYRRVGGIVTLYIGAGALSGTSNSTSMTMTGLPASIQPSASRQIVTRSLNNGVSTAICIADVSGSAIAFGLGIDNVTAGFTAAGTKGLPGGWTISYPL